MLYTLMHKQQPVVELELDDITGIILKIGEPNVPEHYVQINI